MLSFAALQRNCASVFFFAAFFFQLHGDAAEPGRVLWTESRVVGFPDTPPPFRVQRVFENLDLQKPLSVTAFPGTQDLLIHVHPGDYGGPGRLLRYSPTSLSPTSLSHTSAGTELSEFLVLDDIIYGVAFHPDFLRNGYMYIGCNGHSDVLGEVCTRILRFHVARTPPFACDPTSQTTIIEWASNGHNGGDLVFGHDGMLYVSAGDGTSDSDANLAGQDLSTLPGSMLRIDVNRPTVAKPYSVPRDNPFLDLKGARPEIWAYGLRNPWRISVDSKTGELWAGINGQDLWESVQVVRRGENYGWSITEGSHPFHPNRVRGPTPIIPPTIEHPHSEARSLTGGHVYYGTEHPSLYGHYIYGDYSTGIIWAAQYDGTAIVSHFLVARTSLQITGFGIDHEGELLIADHGSGLYRLVASTHVPTHDFPRLLSQTGLFESTADNKLHPGLIPYSVNSPLWSDGAEKERFIALPGAQSVEFQTSKCWNFPDGSVLVKTFSLPIADSNPPNLTRIETRLLTRQQGEWHGYSYEWNEEQTDAELVAAAGRNREILVNASSTEGGLRHQTWHFPSRAECMVCHSRAQEYVLGLSVQQTNLDIAIDGKTMPQLEYFRQLGLFHQASPPNDGGTEKSRESSTFTFPAAFSEMPRLPNPADTTQPLEARARSYLHSNCANCHVKEGGGNSKIDLAFNSPLDKTDLVNAVPLHGSFDLDDAKLIKPSDATASVLLHRMRHRGRGQMPPLATSVIDRDAVEIISQWIQSMPPSEREGRQATSGTP
ncbi:PQQ-dependent sugar dehydrogenase [Aureliella helgolandensis]|uniref:Soluble aldose sugar dehydrogenase YliI n=1 Tax=Aureliella helgolandensis TaxID=2527968 RepID=A0A518G4L4_9BACT|nr:PQQ-dependent sugar dehydrogenase [Aureliella helgolandensis]QDV23522.1 Soluble aldose sugar dehydrogenase YliI precursor [Aureliella helgolandensis]